MCLKEINSTPTSAIKTIREFSRTSLGTLRLVEYDGEPMFMGIDLAAALEYKNPMEALLYLVDTEHMKTVHLDQEVIVLVNFIGVHQFLKNSTNKPKAKEFGEWLLHDIFPSFYWGRPMDASSKNMQQILPNGQEGLHIMELLKENAEQKRLLQEYEQKAHYCDYVLQSKNLIPITQIAKDYGYTAQKMNLLLHELGIQYKFKDTWLLYKKYADKGYTQTQTVLINSECSYIHTYWTQAGRLFIYERLKAVGILPLSERAEQMCITAH